MSQRISALLLAVAVLSGCSTHVVPGAAATAAGKLGARSLTTRDIAAMVAAAVDDHVAPVRTAMPAVLKAPSDVTAQRGLANVYRAVQGAVLPEVDPNADEALAANVIPGFMAQNSEVTNPQILQYVQGIADRLTQAKGVAPFAVHVADIPVLNAFNAGGHALVVFTGLLMAAKDESEVAAVFAHEMTHGLNRHAIQGMVSRDASALASAAVRTLHPVPTAEAQLVNAFAATLAPDQQNDVDFMLGYLQGKVGDETMTNMSFQYNNVFTGETLSRAMEAEADAGGARMTSAAGYNPNGMAALFDRMNTAPVGDTRYYSHPQLGARVGTIRAQIQREGLKGTDQGADRLAAIQALLMPPAPAALLTVPKEAAGAGCFAPQPLPAMRLGGG